MGRDEILSIIDNIGTCEDETERRRMLNEMRDSVGELYDQNEELTNQNTEYAEANEKLRNANTDLFLQLGTRRNARDSIATDTGEEPPKETRKFENLFNEKGEIK